MRIAIYARYSDDAQDPRSIDDQVRLCREHAVRAGLGDVVAVYADYALSGASLRTRPEALRLIADARSGRFERVLVEALDRISRDQEDVAAIYKRLGFAGVALISVAEGEINELHIGLKGTMNALFLKDLAAKVRRGQAGRAAAGSVPGGLAYGYRMVREIDARGELVRGRRAIDEDQASIVRRIFAEYAAGVSPRAIAAALNRDHVPSPTGGAWNASTIGGNRGRASGILWNEAYAGRLVYNRTRFVRDPESGKRISRLNPADRWIVTPVPGLRIVDDAAWAAAQGRHAQYSGKPLHQCRRPRHAFSGLLRCAECGAGYAVRRRDELGCNGLRERGNCANTTVIRVDELERRVLDGLQRRLLAPDAIAAYLQEYHTERSRLHAAERRRSGDLRRRQAEIAGELERLIDALAKGFAAAESLRERVLALEAEKKAAADALADLGTTDEVVTLHPRMIDRYRRRVADLATALAGDPEARRAALSIVREFVEKVEIGPPPAPGLPATVTAYGLLPRVLAFARERQQAANGPTVSVVAGEGFEPPTLGL
jgi:site-specific DNA recombinase